MRAIRRARVRLEEAPSIDTAVRTVGGRQPGVYLPKTFADALGWSPGTALRMRLIGRAIMLESLGPPIESLPASVEADEGEQDQNVVRTYVLDLENADADWTAVE
jgi:hypothetical protein